MEKKDSIFAGLNPAPAPAPAPMPAPRPAAPDPEVAALKQKMDAMERNILTQLEKKIGDRLNSAPPPPPPAAGGDAGLNNAQLLARIAELDKRLEEFARNAITSSVQLKNIEESKISARREIEDLLKVVREQQKYTEMDREMHDQLAKSWVRAEELEKKLIDFCGAVLAGQQNKGTADAARSERDALLSEASASQLADLRKEMTAELARTREETLAFSREQSDFFKSLLEEQVKGRLELIKSTVSAELERSRKETADEIGSFKREFSERMRDMRSMMEDFWRAVQENRAGAESAVKSAAEVSAMLAQKVDQVSGLIGVESGKFLAQLEERNRRSLDALNTKYADALSSASAMDFVIASADASAKKISALEQAVAGFLRQLDKDRLASALGVSGMLVRKDLAAMEVLLAGIRQDAAAMEQLRREVAERLKSSFAKGPQITP